MAGPARFEGRSSLRSWLYRIATNVCLDRISQRRQARPSGRLRPRRRSRRGPGEPLIESDWVERYPDERRAPQDGYASPEAALRARESVELAFIVALQKLPATQRAALILRDVLGFSARETAETLETTVASANGALRRARKAVAGTLPVQSQQANLAPLGDDGLRQIVERYVDAWERADVDAILALLAEDATFAMPPLPTWYRGHDVIAVFLTRFALGDRWRLVPTRANGQLAFGAYAWVPEDGCYTPLSLDVLTLGHDRDRRHVFRDSAHPWPRPRALRHRRLRTLRPARPARLTRSGRAGSTCAVVARAGPQPARGGRANIPAMMPARPVRTAAAIGVTRAATGSRVGSVPVSTTGNAMLRIVASNQTMSVATVSPIQMGWCDAGPRSRPIASR